MLVLNMSVFMAISLACLGLIFHNDKIAFGNLSQESNKFMTWNLVALLSYAGAYMGLDLARTMYSNHPEVQRSNGFELMLLVMLVIPIVSSCAVAWYGSKSLLAFYRWFKVEDAGEDHVIIGG